MFSELQKVYDNGGNINEYLKANQDLLIKNGLNEADAIELSYDLQAGTYLKEFYEKHDKFKQFNKFIVDELKSSGVISTIESLKDKITICDFGTGESTNFNSFLKFLNKEVKAKISAYGMDISLSRLDIARKFSEIESTSIMPEFFIGDLGQLPLLDNCIDISLTMHALEPNGGRENQILNELIRVSKNFMILAEPIYETAKTDQRKRMERFGYIKELRTLMHESEAIEVIRETLMPEFISTHEQNHGPHREKKEDKNK